MLIVLTRDPSEFGAVVAVVGTAALAVAALTALAAVALEERAAAAHRPRAREPRRVAALRRGAALGAIVAALGLLRAIDGLTVITGGFVVAGFVLAELVLSARPSPRSG